MLPLPMETVCSLNNIARNMWLGCCFPWMSHSMLNRERWICRYLVQNNFTLVLWLSTTYLTWILAWVQVGLEACVLLIEVDEHKESQYEQRQETVCSERHLRACQTHQETLWGVGFTLYSSVRYLDNILSCVGIHLCTMHFIRTYWFILWTNLSTGYAYKMYNSKISVKYQ